MVELRFLLSFFSFWLVSHVCRELNNAAHSIAKWAAACKIKGTIPISLIPSEFCVEQAEGDGSIALRFFASS